MAAVGEVPCESVAAGASQQVSLVEPGSSAGLQLTPAARKAQPSDLVALAEQVEKVSRAPLGMCRVPSSSQWQRGWGDS